MKLKVFVNADQTSFGTLEDRIVLTAWKFQDFSVTHILREINFGESRSSKTAVFAFFENLDFVNLLNFSLQKVQNFIKSKIQNL